MVVQQHRCGARTTPSLGAGAQLFLHTPDRVPVSPSIAAHPNGSGRRTNSTDRTTDDIEAALGPTPRNDGATNYTMTIRMVVIGRRRADLSHEECIEYLEAEHLPLVKQLPTLQRLTTAVPLDPDEMGYDEMAELWFDSPSDRETTMESEAWQRVLTDAENFVDLDETVMLTVDSQTVRYQSVPEGV